MSEYLERKRARIEDHLRVALCLAEPCPAKLMEAMAYSLLAPGKRLRPLLVLLAAEACNGAENCALPAASAVEMIHTYSLIHDDLPAMDDDDLRRGLPTCHKKFGEATAILAGDSLLTLAFQVLAQGYPPATVSSCCRELAGAAGAAGMVGGQMDDLAWEHGSMSEWDREKTGALAASLPSSQTLTLSRARAPSLEALESLHSRKTGALFLASLKLGVISAQGERSGGPDLRLLAMMEAYGRCFGLAFQITDDLLDVEGSADQAGKRVQKDAERGKLTYPGLLGVDESRERAERLCEEAQQHLRPLGASGRWLAALVQSIRERRR